MKNSYESQVSLLDRAILDDSRTMRGMFSNTTPAESRTPADLGRTDEQLSFYNLRQGATAGLIALAMAHPIPTIASVLGDAAPSPASLRSRMEPADDLQALIRDARTKLELYFPGAAVKLREQLDPLDGEKQLILGVKIKRDAAAYQAFEKFRQSWWLENRVRADGQLVIKVDG